MGRGGGGEGRGVCEKGGFGREMPAMRLEFHVKWLGWIGPPTIGGGDGRQGRVEGFRA